MRSFPLTLAIALCCLPAFAQGDRPPTSVPPAAAAPASTAEVASYGIGTQIGERLKADGVEVNLNQLFAGLKDGLLGAKKRYTEDQLNAALQAFSREMRAKQEQRTQMVGAGNIPDGKAFLAANGAKPGVTTLPSGLQYKVLQTGQGKSPKATDTVRVHYEGKLIDGTVFDSSLQRGQPASFRVDGVIPGWTEALQRMRVGDKWQLFLPPNLAYGERGAGGLIQPNSVLTFQVELLGITE